MTSPTIQIETVTASVATDVAFTPTNVSTAATSAAPVGAIVGAVVGAIGGFVIVAFLLFLFWRYRRGQILSLGGGGRNSPDERRQQPTSPNAVNPFNVPLLQSGSSIHLASQSKPASRSGTPQLVGQPMDTIRLNRDLQLSSELGLRVSRRTSYMDDDGPPPAY